MAWPASGTCSVGGVPLFPPRPAGLTVCLVEMSWLRSHPCQGGLLAAHVQRLPARPWGGPSVISGRTCLATVRCPSLTLVHFPQRPRSCPEGEGTPGKPLMASRGLEAPHPEDKGPSSSSSAGGDPQRFGQGSTAHPPDCPRPGQLTLPAQPVRGEGTGSSRWAQGLGRPRGSLWVVFRAPPSHSSQEWPLDLHPTLSPAPAPDQGLEGARGRDAQAPTQPCDGSAQTVLTGQRHFTQSPETIPDPTGPGLLASSLPRRARRCKWRSWAPPGGGVPQTDAESLGGLAGLGGGGKVSSLRGSPGELRE